MLRVVVAGVRVFCRHVQLETDIITVALVKTANYDRNGKLVTSTFQIEIGKVYHVKRTQAKTKRSTIESLLHHLRAAVHDSNISAEMHCADVLKVGPNWGSVKYSTKCTVFSLPASAVAF